MSLFLLFVVDLEQGLRGLHVPALLVLGVGGGVVFSALNRHTFETE